MKTVNICVGINVAERATFDLLITGDESPEELREFLTSQALGHIEAGTLSFRRNGDYYDTRILDATVVGTGERLLEDVPLEEEPAVRNARLLREAVQRFLSHQISFDDLRDQAQKLGVIPKTSTASEPASASSKRQRTPNFPSFSIKRRLR